MAFKRSPYNQRWVTPPPSIRKPIAPIALNTTEVRKPIAPPNATEVNGSTVVKTTPVVPSPPPPSTTPWEWGTAALYRNFGNWYVPAVPIAAMGTQFDRRDPDRMIRAASRGLLALSGSALIGARGTEAYNQGGEAAAYYWDQAFGPNSSAWNRSAEIQNTTQEAILQAKRVTGQMGDAAQKAADSVAAAVENASSALSSAMGGSGAIGDDIRAGMDRLGLSITNLLLILAGIYVALRLIR